LGRRIINNLNILKTEQMKTETKKSELAQAFEKLDTLNIHLSSNEHTELTNIFYGLATQSFQKGLDMGLKVSMDYISK
jgi:hypothetical protein|tara:strand:- start:19 stop:252 length:234 start_codon:yes stop_codon:yes gene_type:complete